MRTGFIDLANAQVKIFDKHFNRDMDALTQAFQDFGQGVLYDPRPPRVRTHLIHMMDGTPADWVGYRRWHAFVRAAILSSADRAFWGEILRRIAVASRGVQTEKNPVINFLRITNPWTRNG